MLSSKSTVTQYVLMKGTNLAALDGVVYAIGQTAMSLVPEHIGTISVVEDELSQFHISYNEYNQSGMDTFIIVKVEHNYHKSDSTSLTAIINSLLGMGWRIISVDGEFYLWNTLNLQRLRYV